MNNSSTAEARLPPIVAEAMSVEILPYLQAKTAG
jgi:hypothetical protein